ncbi:MAG: DegT/DnrJ/EryC1/StrS family aminotransferase [Lachnospiraceae bacterium]|nr:DegT/DnrJ/EryC1/StrS family aminotransferase [Lachnospiraceae bacterium]
MNTQYNFLDNAVNDESELTGVEDMDTKMCSYPPNDTEDVSSTSHDATSGGRGHYPPYIFAYTTHAIVRNGITVVFFEDSYGKSRDESCLQLRRENIVARKYFYPIISAFRCYEQKCRAEDTPIAKEMSERVLVLFLYADLALKEIDRICDLLKRR